MGERKALSLSKLNSPGLALYDRPPSQRVRDDIAEHRATRSCSVCGVGMVAGACVDHGRPAEDGGEWLWAPAEASPSVRSHDPFAAAAGGKQAQP